MKGNGFIELVGSIFSVSAAGVGIATAATTGAWIPLAAGVLAGGFAAGTAAFDKHRTIAEQKAELIEELSRLKIQLREQRDELQQNISDRQHLTTKLAIYLEGHDPSLLEIPIVRDRVIYLVAKVANLDKQIAELTQRNAELSQQNADLTEQNADRQKLVDRLAEAERIVERTETEIEREIQLRVLMTLNENSQKAVAKAVEMKVLQLQKAEADIKKLQDQLAENDATFEDLKTNAIPAIKGSFDGLMNARDSELMQLAGQNQLLQQEIAELKAPRHFPGHTSAADIGNRIIDHFAAHGVIFDAHSISVFPNSYAIKFWYYRTDDNTKISMEEFEKIRSQVGLHGLSHKELEFKIDRLNLTVEVETFITPDPKTRTSGKNQQDIGAMSGHKYLEPQLYQGGYNIEANIANDILRLLFSRLQLPLACEGLKISGGDTTVGFGYPVDADPQKLCEAINGYVSEIKKELGLAEVGTAKKLDYANVLTMTFRREPKAQRSKIERLAEFDFGKITHKIIQHLEMKPTIRITGATGDGKGVVARSVLSAVCRECEGWVIRIHDPQHGSAEDHWGIPKVSKSGDQLKANLAGVISQMESRERGVNMTTTTFDIFDEVDTQLSKEDKDQFPIMLSRMRHLNMKACVIGQNPKVARGGLQWSDMGQVIGCYLGSGCLDVIGAHPHLKRKAEELSEQYYELSEWCEFENRKLPIESRYLFGLLVIPGNKPQWFVLPPANQITINVGSNIIATSMKLTNSNHAQNTSNKGLTNSNIFEQNYQFSEPSPSVERVSASMSAQGAQTPLGGVSAKNPPLSAQTALPSCKHHPDAEIRLCNDGRYYCPQCKKKLSKKDLI